MRRALGGLLLLALSGCELLGGPKGGPGLEPPQDEVPGITTAGTGTTNAGPLDMDGDDSPQGGDPSAPTPSTAGAGGAGGFANGGSAGSSADPVTSPPAGSESPTAGTDSAPPPATPSDSSSVPNACGMESYRLARSTDLYLVLDESLAMVEPNDLWTPLSSALGQWLSSAPTAGMELALVGYGGACDTAQYAEPSVTWGQLPDHAGLVLQALAAPDHGAGGAAGVALAGAISHAQARSAASGDPVAVVLLTATPPSGCGSTMFSTALLAATGSLGVPSVPTLVVALGADSGSYDMVAAAGGTQNAIVVDDPTSPESVLSGLRAALGRSSCSFALPDGVTVVDRDLVNVWIDDDAGSRVVPFAAQGCTGGPGWVFGGVTTTPNVELCPASCQELAQGGGTLHVELGCPTVTTP